MNDDQFQKLAAMHSETGRAAYVQIMLHGLVFMGLSTIMATLEMFMLTFIFGLGGLVLYLLGELKIASKDGNSFATKIGSVLPGWETPVPRKDDTMRELRDNDLRADGGRD